MQTPWRHRLFAACTVIFLSGFLAFQVLAAITPWASIKQYSNLEATSLPQPADLLKTSFVDSSMQKTLEKYINSHIPNRDGVILANAAIQRNCISLSNVATGYRYIPTYYGSDCVADLESDLLYPLVISQPSSTSRLEAFYSTLSELCKSRPDMRVFVGLVTEPEQDEHNPTYSLITSKKSINQKWIRENVLSLIDTGKWFFDTSDDIEDLNSGWYNTDHHWTLERSLRSYNAIADGLGLKQYPWREEAAFDAVPEWFGSSARNGRDLDYSSSLIDMDDDFSSLVFHRYQQVPDSELQKANYGLRERMLADPAAAEKLNLYDAYSSYYGWEDCVITNSADAPYGTCLIVGDSYMRCLIRYIASNYKRTVFINPGNNPIESSFEECLDFWNPDDLIVAQHCLKATQIASTSPNFLPND